MKKTYEFAGMTDLVVQMKELISQGVEIDIDSVNGTGGTNYTYYFDATDKEGNLETFECMGRQDLVAKLKEVFEAGGDVDLYTMGAAAGGRGRYFWFNGSGVTEADGNITAEALTLEDLIIEEFQGKEPESVPPAEVEITPAAEKLAKENGVDLSLINGTGSEGKIIKPDIVNYLENK